MPGTKITDHQMHKYKLRRHTHTQVAAAARTGICKRSAWPDAGVPAKCR
jgi:hypothetical protein